MKRLPLLLALSVLAPLTAAAGPLTVKGSDTMVVLTQRWAEEYRKAHPEAKVQVTGGGSGTGLSALINGTTDIALSSRPMKAAEREQLRARHQSTGYQLAVAKDGVTFYVHETNPLSALTLEALKRIYVGEITNWKEVGGPDAPIVLYSRENSSGTYVFVKDELLGGDDFSAAAQTLPGTAAVVNAVAKERNGIGYGGLGYAKGVKALELGAGADTLAPTAENVKSGKYPLSRDLFFYLRSEPTGSAQGFIDFCLSVAGQRLVSQVGYYPVK